MPNKEKQREYSRKYRKANKDKVNKYAKEYYQKNKEEIRRKQKNYNEENNYSSQKQYAKSWFGKSYYCKINNNITTSTARIMAFKATYTECQHCGSNKNLHVDHDHDTGKVRGILCAKCNINDVFAGRGEVL